jgi:phosphoribosylanthranilate isomerase
MMVKICGITSAEDALAAVEAGASAIGFIFYAASPRFVEPSVATKIASALPAGIIKVGVFVNEPVDHIASIAKQAGLDIVQLRGCSAPAGLRFWRMAGHSDNLPPPDGAEAILIDTVVAGMHGGTGQTFPWHLARVEGRRIIVAGGLDATNVREAIRQAHPWGVDACSRIESAPGKKDRKKMTDFIHTALAEAALAGRS